MARIPLEPQDHRAVEPDRPTADRSTGARAADGGAHRKRGLGWLWLLLGLLALAAVVAALAGAFDGSDDAERAAGQTQQQADPNAGAGAGAGAGDEAAGGAGDAGRLVAGDTSLIPVPGGGLGEYVGEQSRGENVRVLTVVSNADDPEALEGFWVGTSDQDRTYVEYGGDVGTDEADFRPEVGQRVNLTGPVRPAPQDPARTLNLSDKDSETVRSQGGYINADEVTPVAG
jgi:hypothetical protein